jgi:hypothetical protein
MGAGGPAARGDPPPDRGYPKELSAGFKPTSALP